MDLYEIAERENLDVGRLFLLAERTFTHHTNQATSDYQKWLEGGPIPSYVQEYASYSIKLERTETSRRR